VFHDTRQLPDQSVISTDLCIVGAGAAGITLAREFIGSGFQVCLLEAGGLEFDVETQSLYKGENLGFDDYPLDASRLRFLGGATNHWNGNIWPLFPDDFEKRDWIPDSGWPISRRDLDPYYEKAAVIAELKGPYQWDPAQMTQYLQGIYSDKRLTSNTVLDRCFFQHSPPTRFGTTYRKDLETATNVQTYLYANAIGLQATDNGEAVNGVTVKCLDGRQVTFRARYVVLAAGAIENARLLLVSDERVAGGLGNGHDLVGRYFSDHPMARIGKVVFTGLEGGLAWPKEAQKLGINGMLTLSPAAMAEHRLARVVSMLAPFARVTTKQVVKRFVKHSEKAWAQDDEDFSTRLGDVASAFGEMSDELWQLHGWGQSESAYLDVVVEQLPNPDSRVVLSTERDALGVRRANLDWRFRSEQGQVTRAAFQLMAEQIGAAGLGRMQITENMGFSNPKSFLFTSSFHHMGTTRMSGDVRKGVVDADCRVHSQNNLYVAGSSVFPTTGVTNPTLTIVALAVRLADHLKAKLA